MERYMDATARLLSDTIMAVLVNYSHNWFALGLAMIAAAIMAVHVDAAKFKDALLRRTKVSIVASVAVGAFTPLCACGTMAVIIGMLTTSLPWGPVMAFLTSSPLMSPDGFILLAGVVGLKFAAAVAAASVVVGLVSGFGTHLIEKNSRFLENQTKFAKTAAATNSAGGPAAAVTAAATAAVASAVAAPVAAGASAPAAPTAASACACGGGGDCGGGGGGGRPALIAPAAACCASSAVPSPASAALAAAGTLVAPLKLREIGKQLVDVGLKRILFSFTIFVALGYLIQSFVPTEFIVALFNAGNGVGVPLAALIGLPLYVTGDAAIPLIKTLLDQGASGGSMLAFMITGPATSAWVIAGISTFMKRRVVALYLGWILGLGVALGYAYDLLLALGL
ncbi:MAG: hypothetical protein A2Z99_16810 [Treponema sp. GWB1_62_6]|nr:MAG: hypothetical protein A2001_15520 [Treponema sp. GWC1_61_84]OHE65592.1 MAG: hypothetical protein A2Z99_16810 [Treponema sp. GWB1_62_6]